MDLNEHRRPRRSHMVLVDVDILTAGLDSTIADHRAAAALLAIHAGRLAVTVPVLTDTATRIPAGLLDLLADLQDGQIHRVDLDDDDWHRVGQLSAQHVGLAQASIIAVAERLDVTTVATLQPAPYKASHRPLTLVP